jgi:hypothetical protein
MPARVLVGDLDPFFFGPVLGEISAVGVLITGHGAAVARPPAGDRAVESLACPGSSVDADNPAGSSAFGTPRAINRTTLPLLDLCCRTWVTGAPSPARSCSGVATFAGTLPEGRVPDVVVVILTRSPRGRCGG